MWRCGSSCHCSNACGGVGPSMFVGGMSRGMGSAVLAGMCAEVWVLPCLK